MGGVKQSAKVFPVREVTECVCSEQEEHFIVRAQLPPRRANRIDGIAQAPIRRRLFQKGREEARVSGRGQNDHGVATREGGESVLRLVRRVTGRHKKNSVEPELSCGGPGGPQVAGVDGIKRSAKKRDSQDGPDLTSFPLVMDAGSSPGFGNTSSSAHTARFRSSRPSPVTAEISHSFVPRERAKFLSAISRD